MVVAPNGNVYVINQVGVGSDLVSCTIYRDMSHYTSGDTEFLRSIYRAIPLVDLDAELQNHADGGISVKQNVFNVAEAVLNNYLSSGGV